VANPFPDRIHRSPTGRAFSRGAAGGAARPEVLAPAGDEAALEAAISAGADAVYFGLSAWNARARATNFSIDSLGATMGRLHAAGCKGYVTLNTLVFDSELPGLEAAIRACAAAAVDAIIVQDLGVARLARAVAPGLRLHASTQMTCTDAGSVELARSLGAKRVVLARELSLTDIAAIRAQTDLELEVFVHGALCIAYSGQCLTSEAIGGRSANRGACAQSCRLPYDLVVDGQVRALGDRAYLLSPEDLEASALVGDLAKLGVVSLKIEGRLKGPEYVAATTRLYRSAVDAVIGAGPPPGEPDRQAALQTYSRGSGPGFLQGIDHQRLVDGRGCEHRGLEVGRFLKVSRNRGRSELVLETTRPLARGEGLVVEGGRAGAGEIGGRIWELTLDGKKVARVPAGRRVGLWLGPDVVVGDAAGLDGHRVFRTHDPEVERRVRAAIARGPDVEASHEVLHIYVSGELGAPARFDAWVEPEGADGVDGSGGARAVSVVSDQALRAEGALDLETARAQLGRLGGTGFVLGDVTLALPAGAGLPLSSLNRVRRAIVDGLAATSASSKATIAVTPVTAADLLAAAAPPARTPPPAGLFVLCRRLAQAQAALAAGADGVYLDILELTGTGDALRRLRAEGAGFIGLAPPRIRKPGEEKIDRFLRSLGPDALLIRGLGALYELGQTGTCDKASSPLAIADFSLNVTNRITATEVLQRGAGAFTPSYDLDAGQLRTLLAGPLAPWAEVVVHHPMPLFHMEHCVIAAELSEGRDHLTCGRPCEHHQLTLRDRAGVDHPVEADVGCRNTVFHAAAQSGADLIPALRSRGVGRYRIELVRENAAEVAHVVALYRALIDGRITASEVWRALRSQTGAGVVRGSLRVVSA
jgi:putative protease